MNKKQLMFICIIGLFLSPFESRAENQNKPTIAGKELKGDDYQEYAYGTSLFGGMWNKLEEGQKRSYMMGFEDASLDIIARYIPEDKRDEIINGLPSFYHDSNPDTFIEKLDEFYADNININIPLPLALIIIRADFQGVPYDAKTEELIKFYMEELYSIVGDKEGVADDKGEEAWVDSLNVKDYYKGHETTYKDWAPFISEVNGEPIVLYESTNFLFAYTSELEKKYNVKIDAEDIQLKEFDEYFSKASDDDLIIDLIERFFVERGLLPKEKRD